MSKDSQEKKNNPKDSPKDDQNQTHNIKKESLGPNTKR